MSACKVAYSIWLSAFRCNFIPLWAHGSSHGIRTARLCLSQYTALNSMNSATKLTMTLSLQDQLAAQRLALQRPSSGLMTLEDVGNFLGLPGIRGTSCNSGVRNTTDAVNVIGASGEKGAATFLQFCRVAALAEQVVMYDLGEKTRKLQLRALIKRSLVDEIPGYDTMTSAQLLDVIPEHTKNLCVCVQCRRVANAIAVDGGSDWRKCFNEIGVGASMLSTDHETQETHLRCSKRPSTSLKAAMVLEEEMNKNVVDEMDVRDHVVRKMVDETVAQSTSGAASRVRRDAKTSMEQRECSITCCHNEMLSIPMFGYAIRLWEQWYGLCSFCGCFVRVQSSNRFDTELCCLRCDYDMLNRKNTLLQTINPSESSSVQVCRFCAKPDPRRAGARWRFVKSPMDTSGLNSSLPPPIRFVYFCPQHFRSWIPTCMKTMKTRVILSHIVYGAKPCYDNKSVSEIEEGQNAKSVSNKKRKAREPKFRNKSIY